MSGRSADRPRQQTAAPSPSGNPSARRMPARQGDQRRVHGVREQQRRVEAPVGSSAPADRQPATSPIDAARGSTIVWLTSGTRLEQRRDRRPRRHGDRCARRRAPHVGDRRQRHDGVAKPVRSEDDQAVHRVSGRKGSWRGGVSDPRGRGSTGRATLRTSVHDEDRAAADQSDRRRPGRQRTADRRRGSGEAARRAPISPSRPSSRWSATCRAICLLSDGFVRRSWDALDSARARRSPICRRCSSGCRSRTRPTKDARCFNSAGAAAQRPRRAAVPQGAAADLRRLRRGPLLRAVPRRRSCSSSAAHRARHQHLRGHLERPRLLEAPPLSPRSDRGADRAPAPSRSSTCRRRRSPPASTAGARRCSSSMARRHRVPIAYVNQFGGNDDLVFDGRSCAFDADGAPIARGRVVRRRRRRSATSTTRRPIAPARRSAASNRRSGARSCSARATTRGKCGFSARRARPVRRHRLGADRGDRRRGARRRSRARRADAVALSRAGAASTTRCSWRATSASRR